MLLLFELRNYLFNYFSLTHLKNKALLYSVSVRKSFIIELAIKSGHSAFRNKRHHKTMIEKQKSKIRLVSLCKAMLYLPKFRSIQVA